MDADPLAPALGLDALPELPLPLPDAPIGLGLAQPPPVVENEEVAKKVRAAHSAIPRAHPCGRPPPPLDGSPPHRLAAAVVGG